MQEHGGRASEQARAEPSVGEAQWRIAEADDG